MGPRLLAFTDSLAEALVGPSLEDFVDSGDVADANEAVTGGTSDASAGVFV